MRRICAKSIAFALSAVMFTASAAPIHAEAAKKIMPKLSKTKVTMTAGNKKKITVKNAKAAKVKSVKWTVNKKGKKVIKLTGKTKKQVTIRALKKGSAVVTVKIKTKKKTVTKKIKVTVKKKSSTSTANQTKQPTAAPTPSQKPAPTPTPAPKPSVTKMPTETAEPTKAPAIYGEPGKAAAYDKEKTNYSLKIDSSKKVHEISDMLFGAFIEDINFAADGGLYAEMVQNRSFEFTELAAGDEKHAWSNVGAVTANVNKTDSTGCLNKNNPSYMVLENQSDSPAGIANRGFLEGMAVKENARYNFSVWAKGLDGYTGPVHVAIMNGMTVLAQGEISALTANWHKYELELTTNKTAVSNVKLQVTINKGKAAVDMVSLFPQDTFKGRENGMRKDLAEKLEALHPSFLRFPGGCVVEGYNLEGAYDWKSSIGVDKDGEPLSFNGVYGDVAARRQGQNVWTDETATNDQNPSYMSYGLGFYEYFQLAEDIGAIGVPVINCGMSCLIQTPAGGRYEIADVQPYVQDALDLVEFCRGDSSTKWGAVRISMGHEEPFELKYIGIGNEQWGNEFYQHYEAFVEAFDKAKKENPEMYGDIELMYSAGVDDGDSGLDYMPAYQEAERWLKENPDKTIQDFAGAVDHHYYNEPSWFLEHTDYYDEANYARDAAKMTETKYGGGIPVFLGEYASFSNTWNSALAEAAYMTGLERNGDIVKMAAYAPLFGNLTALHWAPDLIWFNNHTSTNSVNYYVQKVFAENVGSYLLESGQTVVSSGRSELKGKVGLGTWDTSAEFDNVKIVNNDDGKTIAYDNFDTEDSLKLNWQKISDGNWTVKNGKLVQSSTTTNTDLYSNTGSAVYFGSPNWKNYTYTVDAVKTGGQEGFLIPIAVADDRNNYFWNIGGWGNTVSCLQQVSDGTKSGQMEGTVRDIALTTGTTYKLKVVVNGYNIKCYVNDVLYIDYTVPDTENAESYQVVSTDDTGDIIIKMVNVTGLQKTFAIDIAGAETIGGAADLHLVAGNSLADDNILGKEEVVTLKSSTITGIGKQFNYTAPKYSVSVLRVKTK